LKLKAETGFVGSASDLSFDDLIVEPSFPVDPPIAPAVLALICASPLLLLALLAFAAI